MKPLGNLSKLMAYGVALVAINLIPAAEAITGKAVVRSIRGTAAYAEQGGEYQDLRVGKVLGPGTYVKTSPSSQVDLFLGDNGPTVRLLADTTLGLDQLEVDRTGTDIIILTQLNLTQGTIQGSVKQMHPASRYEVKTPFGVAGIRGTEYEISVDGTVRVWEGSLLVAYTNPVTRVVTTHTVNTGETFTPPVDPQAPNAVPQVGPTPPSYVPPVLDTRPPPATGPTTTPSPVVLVPDPFISPIIGQVN